MQQQMQQKQQEQKKNNNYINTTTTTTTTTTTATTTAAKVNTSAYLISFFIAEDVSDVGPLSVSMKTAECCSNQFKP